MGVQNWPTFPSIRRYIHTELSMISLCIGLWKELLKRSANQHAICSTCCGSVQSIKFLLLENKWDHLHRIWWSVCCDFHWPFRSGLEWVLCLHCNPHPHIQGHPQAGIQCWDSCVLYRSLQNPVVFPVVFQNYSMMTAYQSPIVHHPLASAFLVRQFGKRILLWVWDQEVPTMSIYSLQVSWPAVNISNIAS